MFETVSVFDAMELDDTDRRVASRRTLALAHNRVERNLGLFLRTASSEEDFNERMALVQDDFAGYITVAAEETGHENPEHVAAALRDHYRSVAQRNSENAAKKRWSNLKPVSGDKQSAPLASDPWGNNDVQANVCPQCGQDSRWCPHGQGGLQQSTPDQWIQPPNMGFGDQYAPAPQRWAGENDPSKQRDNENDLITCPECGGDGKTAGAHKCPKCKGRGEVSNFGPSVVDSSVHTAEEWQNNLNMTEPEEPINKSQGPGKMPEVPGDIKKKDILEPIPARNPDKLEEIGDIEHVELPTATGMDDSGFNTEQKPSVEKGNWPKVPQADPVTRTTQSSSEGNPLVSLLEQQWPSAGAVERAFHRI